jgi:hypothetical protein
MQLLIGIALIVTGLTCLLVLWSVLVVGSQCDDTADRLMEMRDHEQTIN